MFLSKVLCLIPFGNFVNSAVRYLRKKELNVDFRSIRLIASPKNLCRGFKSYLSIEVMFGMKFNRMEKKKVYKIRLAWFGRDLTLSNIFSWL